MKAERIPDKLRNSLLPLWLFCTTLCAFALLSSCRTQPPSVSLPPPPEVPSSAEPSSPAPNKSGDARLKPGLSISMSVLVGGKPEIDAPAKRISEGGTIVLPLLGEMAVSEMTLDELRIQLIQNYRKYFVDPQIILDFAPDSGSGEISPWGAITVLGRVKTPGRVVMPATRDLTVSGAIQKAGGFDTSAKMNAILVSRPRPDGKIETRTVNLNAVGKSGRLEEDIVLEADDVVYVPESMF